MYFQGVRICKKGEIMEAIVVMLEDWLHLLVNWGIILFEFMGVMVLLLSGIHGIYEYFKRDSKLKLNLANGMALGLEFKLGSEILRTVVVREVGEIVTVAGLIALRAALTFLIHWEIKEEEAHEGVKERKVEHFHRGRNVKKKLQSGGIKNGGNEKDSDGE